MSALGLRLLVDGAVGFGTVVLWVLALDRLLRAPRLRIWLWSLPPAKLLFIALAGVPDDAFTRTGAARWDLGSFQIGVGLDWLGPNLVATLGAIRDGMRYQLSAGDLAVTFLERRFHTGFATLALAFVLTLALVRVGGRIARWARFERHRRGAMERALWRRPMRAGTRIADVYVTTEEQGAPFAGGLWRPYVCLPASACERLDRAELEAVIAHELAHVARFDVLSSTATRVASDVLWFLPGAWLVVDRLLAALELGADRRAVSRGADPLRLASAIVSLASAAPHHALGATGTGRVRERVEQLVGARRPAWWHWLVIALAANLALGAIVLGDAH